MSDAGKTKGDEVTPGTPQSAENVCPACGGSGKIEDQPCGVCGGSGRVIELVGDA